MAATAPALRAAILAPRARITAPQNAAAAAAPRLRPAPAAGAFACAFREAVADTQPRGWRRCAPPPPKPADAPGGDCLLDAQRCLSFQRLVPHGGAPGALTPARRGACLVHAPRAAWAARRVRLAARCGGLAPQGASLRCSRTPPPPCPLAQALAAAERVHHGRHPIWHRSVDDRGRQARASRRRAPPLRRRSSCSDEACAFAPRGRRSTPLEAVASFWSAFVRFTRPHTIIGTVVRRRRVPAARSRAR